MPPSRNLRGGLEDFLSATADAWLARRDAMRKIKLRAPGDPEPTTAEEIERQAASDEESARHSELSALIDSEGEKFVGAVDWTRVLFMAAGIHMREKHANHDVLGGLCGPCVRAALLAGEEMRGAGYVEANQYRADMDYRSEFGEPVVEVLGIGEDEGLPPGIYGGPNA